MSILALAAGGATGVTGQVLAPMKLPVGWLILGTVAVGYAIGGDRPGTFGRGVMWSAGLLPLGLALYVGVSLANGGKS